MIAVAAMDCGREQLLCKVKRKVVCIQDTIASISKKQQNLHRSAVGVKSEINSAISRQLESLRNREVWILDQVDVILRIQDQLLQEHIVCLMHELGGLQRLLEIAQCHEEVGEGLTEELAQTLARLGLFNLQPIEDTTLNFTADMASLRRAIHDFGEISAKRPRLSQDMDVGMSENKEKNPAFDLSYNPSDWLIRKTTSLPANLSEDDFEIVDDEQSETDIEIVPSISEDVDPPAWPATEPAPTFGHFEELLRSPLEDWLQDCGHNQAEFSEEISYFKEVSQDMKTWLIDNEQKMEEEGEEMQEDEEGEDEEEDMISCPKPVCACTATVEGPQFYEIENLAQLLCIQDATQSQSTSKEKSFNTNMWLARSQEQSKEEKDVDVQEKDEYEKTRPNIAKVCRANELCRDFSECVFDTNCCLNDSAGLSPWLMSNAGTCCEKLHESQGMSDKSTDLDSWLIRGSSRYGISEKQSDWLAVDRETTPAANDFPSPIDGFLRQQSNDIYDWLVSDVKDGGQVSVGKGFESYFEHLSNEPSDWLVQAKQDPTTNLVSPLESYFQQRSENLSDWLIQEKTEPLRALNWEPLSMQYQLPIHQTGWSIATWTTNKIPNKHQPLTAILSQDQMKLQIGSTAPMKKLTHIP